VGSVRARPGGFLPRSLVMFRFGHVRAASDSPQTQSPRTRTAVWPTNLNVESIPSCIRKVAQITERSTRSATMPALDRCRGRCIFRAIENNAYRVTIHADNSKFSFLEGRVLKL
jgi:hypothetical protein